MTDDQRLMLTEGLTLLEEHYQRAARPIPRDSADHLIVGDKLAAIEDCLRHVGTTVTPSVRRYAIPEARLLDGGPGSKDGPGASG